jgi:HEAT repeat protein
MMFSDSKNPFDHLVEKNQWVKITEKLSNANARTRLEIASACGKSKEDDSANVLIRLLRDNDEAVQLQAVQSLGMNGRSTAKTHLMWLMDHLPEGREHIKVAIREANASIGLKY